METKLVTYATVRFTIHCDKRDISINGIMLNFGLMFKITPHCHAHAEWHCTYSHHSRNRLFASGVS